MRWARLCDPGSEYRCCNGCVAHRPKRRPATPKFAGTGGGGEKRHYSCCPTKQISIHRASLQIFAPYVVSLNKIESRQMRLLSGASAAWRGVAGLPMRCMWRWKTSCPPLAPSLTTTLSFRLATRGGREGGQNGAGGRDQYAADRSTDTTVAEQLHRGRQEMGSRDGIKGWDQEMGSRGGMADISQRKAKPRVKHEHERPH